MAKSKQRQKPKKNNHVLTTDLGPLKPGEVVLNFLDNTEIVTHLFVLKTAKMKKWEHWKALDKMQPQEREMNLKRYMVEYDHQHSFRTLTSQGEWMDGANAVGGHYHLCDVVMDKETGKPKVDERGFLTITVGPAVTFSGGAVVPYPWDQHTHEAEYIRSNKIKIQSISPEVVAKMDQLDKAMGLRPQVGFKIIG